MSVKSVAVIGGGSFGTVMANIIALNGHNTRLWMRDADQVESLNTTRQNTLYLPGHELHDRVVATHDLKAAVEDVDMIFVAVPSGSFRAVVKQMRPYLHEGVILISSTKGIEAITFRLMSQILARELPFSVVPTLPGK
jgi:glycerol-3-phosphate dehydrogenase (NAD(P)+)